MAERIEEGRYQLDNTPFFARGVSLEDVVATEEIDDMHVFRSVVQPSGHSTIRVVHQKESILTRLRQELAELGCPSERSHIPNLIGVDVPTIVKLAVVRRHLDIGEKQGKWEYEESAIRQ